MTQTKSFHLRDILSLTTDRRIGSMEGVYEALSHMVGASDLCMPTLHIVGVANTSTSLPSSADEMQAIAKRFGLKYMAPSPKNKKAAKK